MKNHFTAPVAISLQTRAAVLLLSLSRPYLMNAYPPAISTCAYAPVYVAPSDPMPVLVLVSVMEPYVTPSHPSSAQLTFGPSSDMIAVWLLDALASYPMHVTDWLYGVSDGTMPSG